MKRVTALESAVTSTRQKVYRDNKADKTEVAEVLAQDNGDKQPMLSLSPGQVLSEAEIMSLGGR